MRGGARLASAVAVIAVTLIATAPPAGAHTVSLFPPTNYQSEFLSLVPAVPGITFRVRELGTLVEIVNDTPRDLVILGYQQEPYLRVGAAGVFQNARSPTLYQNLVTVSGATATIPPEATPSAQPDWHRIGTGRTVRWRDHRTRHEGPAPTQVRAHPDTRRVIGEWSIPMVLGTTPVVAAGFIQWLPPPDPTPWVVLATVAAFAIISLSQTRHGRAVIIVATVALVGVDIGHTIFSAAPAANSVLGAAIRMAVGSWYSLVAWGAGVAAVYQLERHNEDGLFLAIFAAASLVLFGGASDFTMLIRSQVAYAAPPSVARVAVGLTLGLGLGIVVGSIMRLRRRPRRALNAQQP